MAKRRKKKITTNHVVNAINHTRDQTIFAGMIVLMQDYGFTEKQTAAFATETAELFPSVMAGTGLTEKRQKIAEELRRQRLAQALDVSISDMETYETFAENVKAAGYRSTIERDDDNLLVITLLAGKNDAVEIEGKGETMQAAIEAVKGKVV